MCNKNCCNHTYHAIIVLFILSFLLLPNAPNLNLLLRLTDLTRSLAARGGAGGGESDGGFLSPPCTTTKMILAFLYGAVFTLILTIISNNSNSSSSPKQAEHQPSTSGGPYRTAVYTGPTTFDGGGGGGADEGGVGYGVLRTFPTFTYSLRWPSKLGKGSKACVICQCKFRDEELVRWLPDCDHLFHVCCIDEWLKSHSTCPCCRAELDYSETNNNGSISLDDDDVYYDYFIEYSYNAI